MSGSIRVLHVDDEPDFADMAATYLEREDERFDVETATSASDGFSRLAADDFDCIVSDYDMPQTDGIDFLESVREEYPDLPFILFTGKGSEEVASEAISAGVTDYLQKQGDASQYAILTNRITNAVGQDRAQRALDDRTQRLELAIQQTNSGVWEYDVESRTVVRHEGASDLWAAETHTTVPIEEAITERVYPEDQQAVWDAIEATVEDGEPYHVQFRHDTPDGYRWVEARGELVSENDAGSGRLIACTTDIHAYKTREQELRETTARLTALFEHSPDMINVHDIEGNIIDPNPRLCEKTGYDKAELTEMNVWDMDPTTDPDDIRALWEGMETGDRHELEGRYERRDGSTFPVEVHISRLDLDGDDRFVAISHDITDRTERQRELELYETMIETVPDGVYALDENFRYVAVNREMADLTGYSKEELIGSHVSLVVGEDVMVEARRQRDELAAGGIDDTVMRAEHYHRTADGEAIPTEVRYRALPPDDDGSFRGTAGVLRDISEQKERERNLEEYREYTDRLLDAIDDVFFVYDEDGNLQRWNESLADVTGYPEEELGSMNAVEFIPEAHRERTAAAIREVFETGHARLEAPVLTKDGTTIPYEYVASRVEHPDGGSRLVGIGRDITERTETEKQLRTERNRLSALFETAPQPMFEGTVETVDEFRINDVNDEFEATFGYDRTEIVGQDPLDALVPEQARSKHEWLRERVVAGDSFSAEVERTTVDGVRTFLLDVVTYGTETTPADGWFASYTDITERTERERELKRQNERLEEFASVLSHDLRNPLGVAEGRLELARAECNSEHLADVADALDRMDVLIDDILTVAREGTAVEATEPTDIAAVVDACWRNVETAGATLTVDTDRTIHADPSRFQQLLENLVRNAIEHGGTDVTIAVGDLPDGTGFYLEDDGPGIPDDERERVFESGYSTTDEGTGFGLSIVREIAQAHGWEVHLTTSADGGARFEITGVEIDA